MDVKTKMMIRGYQTYFRVLGSISTDRAARAALNRFLRPRFRKKRSAELPIFRKAEWDRITVDGHSIAHYYWQGSSNQCILLAHGWESDSGTFAPMIEYLLEKGWSVRAVDAPAHGQSESDTVNLPRYASVINSILGKFRDIRVAVGHSFGGMALAFANDTAENKHFPPTVMIASALELRQSLAPYTEILKLKPGVVRGIYEEIEKMGGHPVPWYSVDRMLSSTNNRFLVIHDRNDRVCPIADLDPLLLKEPENVEFHITKGLGHNRIIKDRKVWDRIDQFAGTL